MWIAPLIVLFIIIVVTLSLAKKERASFLTSMNPEPGMVHSVHRSHIYDDVIKLYTEKCSVLVNEYPLFVQFCDELTVDTGGVTRDIFSAFFDDFYLRLFDGPSLLYPAVHASIEVNGFTTIGTILSNAYLIKGIFLIEWPFLALLLLYLAQTQQFPNPYFVIPLFPLSVHILRFCTLCIENGQLRVPF